jgi:hypothetical protein
MTMGVRLVFGFRWQAQQPASAPVVAMPHGMDFWYTVHGMCRGHKDMPVPQQKRHAMALLQAQTTEDVV